MGFPFLGGLAERGRKGHGGGGQNVHFLGSSLMDASIEDYCENHYLQLEEFINNYLRAPLYRAKSNVK